MEAVKETGAYLFPQPLPFSLCLFLCVSSNAAAVHVRVFL